MFLFNHENILEMFFPGAATIFEKKKPILNLADLSKLCVVKLYFKRRYVFWDITPCSRLKVSIRFGGICRLHLQGRRISQRRCRCQALLVTLSKLLCSQCRLLERKTTSMLYAGKIFIIPWYPLHFPVNVSLGFNINIPRSCLITIEEETNLGY
jgi:hypothetical protein